MSSVAYYDELGAEFNEGFRLFRAQASELYKESRTLVWIFFQVQINLEELVPTKPGDGVLILDGIIDIDEERDADDPPT